MMPKESATGLKVIRRFVTPPAVGALCFWILMFAVLIQLRGPLALVGDWGNGGIFLIGLICGVATALAELLGYILGSRANLVSQAGPPSGLFSTHLRRWGDPGLFAFAILPGPFTVVSIWAGKVRYPIWRFVICVTAGKVAKFTALAFAGYYSLPSLFQPVS